MADKGGGQHYQPHHLTLTQADQDIIKSFLSSVPAGFPLSPGAALAELSSSFSPLSPSLPSSSYHFSLSPARVQDPPALHSPKRSGTSQRTRRAGSSQSRAVSPDLTRPRSPAEYLPRDTWSPHNQQPLEDTQTDYFKRPRLSNSPTQSSSPRHNIDYYSLHPIGSFSPRRPSYSLPPSNPYSPVNPPAPFSPRRAVTPGDHRYYDHLQLPPSPSQQTHPPSPSRNLELSPTSQVLEPLDLDIHQPPSFPATKQEPPPGLSARSKPLTQSVKKKLGLVKSKSKSKSKHKRASGSSKVAEERKPPAVCSSVLETDLSQVEARLSRGCGCELKCFSELDSDFVWRHRCNIAELSKVVIQTFSTLDDNILQGEHDMYLMGIMMASLANPRATSKQKERQRNRNKYIFQGKETCQEAFLYLENVTVYQLKSIRRHVIENDVVARVHKNTGKKPHNVLELDHYQLTHRFVQDFLEKENSGTGSNRKKTFLADLTCKKLHSRYLEYFSHLGLDSKTMAYSTFRSFVHQRFPQLKFTSREAILHNVEKPNISINISASNINEIDDTVLGIGTDAPSY